ncbi:ATP-dependent acyl-CoA ligase [Pseudohalioglobus sediminis]|uniref:ATP-dependent acyl-CoA ligase n=1 Tax=Pseudohalioglobus sediminis TaxID=2606449 RepID=A0A5B0X3K1_9GAMM|nr:AMP-binding protein [Pseudohalioglobus sediminis]KAA1193188.1 ATP-dependent acyl-CoA ligase [Pseudohalioglobus sediminis]
MKLDLTHPQERLLGKILDRHAEQSADTRFLVTDDTSISFADAAELTNRLAAGLLEHGIGPGDRVVLFLGNCPEMVLLTLAANKIGAVWVPINTDFRGDWLLDAVSRSRPAMIVTESRLAPRLAEIEQQLPAAQRFMLEDDAVAALAGAIPYSQLVHDTPLVPDYSKQDYGDTSAILWTSGTTGRSKGVMQSHNNWIRAIVDGAARMYDSAPDDVCYCPLPLYNSGAWITCVYRALIEGIPVVLEDKFSVSTFWERINHFGATQIFAIGAMGSFLMNAPESAEDRNNTLRTALIVPMAPDLWQAFEQRFDVRLLTSGLGMSECLLIMNQLECPPGTLSYALGRPPADLDVALCDDNGKPVADGEAGEMCLREKAPHVLFKGYFDDNEATVAAFREEWFLTGDMARYDPESGVYFFCDRKKDAVRFAGRNISTLEVESVVRRHPEVADVAAYGIPAKEIESEDELKLSVVRKPGSELTAEALCEFINSHAPYFFVPRYLDFVANLPYTPTQKVQKYRLREQGNSDATWDLRASGFKVRR